MQINEYDRGKINSASNLGLAGSIFIILGLILNFLASFVGIALSLIGYILILVSLYELSQAYKNNLIFDNAIKGLIAAIAGSILLAIIAVTFIVAIFTSGFSPTTLSLGLPLVIIILILAYAILIIYGYYIKESYFQLSKSSGVKSFESVGKLYWYGTLLAIIVVGIIIIIIGDIYAILAFHELSVVSNMPITTNTNQ
ncbi:DUF996 domain-containing protein [Caldisphaera sp.]|uniref:DUF996 domain-containing protein n=1 Tax=Caldisphaera sp. TaxID=2060322 RepID=UPI0025C47295|nr:DUF996 domain-containing protein [Caldisphaera sp.]